MVDLTRTVVVVSATSSQPVCVGHTTSCPTSSSLTVVATNKKIMKQRLLTCHTLSRVRELILCLDNPFLFQKSCKTVPYCKRHFQTKGRHLKPKVNKNGYSYGAWPFLVTWQITVTTT